MRKTLERRLQWLPRAATILKSNPISDCWRLNPERAERMNASTAGVIASCGYRKGGKRAWAGPLRAQLQRRGQSLIGCSHNAMSRHRLERVRRDTRLYSQ